MAFFKRGDRFLRRVEPGDLGYATVVASLDNPPGPARDDAIRRVVAEGVGRPGAELYVYDGENGGPVGVASLTDAGDGVGELWIAVDPLVRRYGIGERIFTEMLARARKLGLRAITAQTAHVEGMAFMASHGFEATSSVEPESQADEILGVRPSGEPVSGRLDL